MDELYAIADVFVTKPGGLTTAEALNWNLPIIVTHWLPGQEELNINYLSKKQLILAKPKDLANAVERELKTGELEKSLVNSKYTQALVKDGKEIITVVLGLLHEV